MKKLDEDTVYGWYVVVLFVVVVLISLVYNTYTLLFVIVFILGTIFLTLLPYLITYLWNKYIADD